MQFSNLPHFYGVEIFEKFVSGIILIFVEEIMT